MILSDKEIDDRIISIMRKHFLKFTSEVIEKYKTQIDNAVRWYISSLPQHVAKSESDDLASEAKIAFVDSLKTWDPRVGELWPYANIRLKGAMQDYLRRRGSDPVTGVYEWIVQAANVYMAFNQQTIHQDFVDDSLHIETAMKDLSEVEQKVIDGYYKKDKTFKQIGEDIGLSESQVSRIAKTATEKMKNQFKK